MARLYYLLNVAQHRLGKRAKRECEEQLGVTAAQLGALFIVDEQPGLRQNALAEGLSCNKSAVTALVERLSERELIERSPCPDDGRATRLRLTRRGKRTVEKGRPMVARLQDRLTDGFSRAEMQTVARFLRATIERF